VLTDLFFLPLHAFQQNTFAAQNHPKGRVRGIITFPILFLQCSSKRVAPETLLLVLTPKCSYSVIQSEVAVVLMLIVVARRVAPCLGSSLEVVLAVWCGLPDARSRQREPGVDLVVDLRILVPLDIALVAAVVFRVVPEYARKLHRHACTQFRIQQAVFGILQYLVECPEVLPWDHRSRSWAHLVVVEDPWDVVELAAQSKVLVDMSRRGAVMTVVDIPSGKIVIQ
jgi:hypothetical protein